MCIGVPSQVVALGDQTATVDSLGQQRDVSLLMLDEPVAIGDYLLIQVGGFAVEKIAPEDAQEALATLMQLQEWNLAEAT
ncbi:HypC/HybG/HupF family hydrogenase formation chaperone [Photobacterium sagamiensis]|uniref:HypC/HybG/HupF family hydrogenase formation chaperone n=1 Tax=Photobacterium sagamiensis TaxID=2910241 RepID=UPI003D1441C9